jgi:hypothetical protein
MENIGIVIYTSLGTMYNGSSGGRGLGPHLKAGRANGRAGRGRRNRLPSTRPLAVSNGYLAPGKTAQGCRRQGKTTGVSWGNEMTAAEAGGSMAIGLRLGRERVFLGVGIGAIGSRPKQGRGAESALPPVDKR